MANASAIIEPLESISELFTGLISQILVALIIFFIGFIIGKLLGKLTTKILDQLNLDYFLRKALGVRFSFEDLIGAFVTYFIYFISLIMALNQVGLTTTMFMIIFTAIVVLIVISIVLSIKDFIPNFISGLMIRQKNFIQEEDVIQVKNIKGKVVYIDLLETQIQNSHKDIIYVPNSILTKHEIINYKIEKKKKANKAK